MSTLNQDNTVRAFSTYNELARTIKDECKGQLTNLFDAKINAVILRLLDPHSLGIEITIKMDGTSTTKTSGTVAFDECNGASFDIYVADNGTPIARLRYIEASKRLDLVHEFSLGCVDANATPCMTYADKRTVLEKINRLAEALGAQVVKVAKVAKVAVSSGSRVDATQEQLSSTSLVQLLLHNFDHLMDNGYLFTDGGGSSKVANESYEYAKTYTVSLMNAVADLRKTVINLNAQNQPTIAQFIWTLLKKDGEHASYTKLVPDGLAELFNHEVMDDVYTRVLGESFGVKSTVYRIRFVGKGGEYAKQLVDEYCCMWDSTLSNKKHSNQDKKVIDLFNQAVKQGIDLKSHLKMNP